MAFWEGKEYMIMAVTVLIIIVGVVLYAHYEKHAQGYTVTYRSNPDWEREFRKADCMRRGGVYDCKGDSCVCKEGTQGWIDIHRFDYIDAPRFDPHARIDCPKGCSYNKAFEMCVTPRGIVCRE